jgi:hypothetical protein
MILSMTDPDQWDLDKAARAYLAPVAVQPAYAPEEVEEATNEIRARCKAATIPVEDAVRFDGTKVFRLGLKNGREHRWLSLSKAEWAIGLCSIPFEKFVFLSDFQAICCYEEGYIEAGIRQIGTGIGSSGLLFRRMFDDGAGGILKGAEACIVLRSEEEGLPHVEISRMSEQFSKLVLTPLVQLTLKIVGCRVATHDQALALLKKTADAVFFQIDLLSGPVVALDRERRPQEGSRRPQRRSSLKETLKYPNAEYDEAPISLYWYGRSAAGMPLLQFLAFYQVIEFYFPTYSKAEAQRRLRAILKDPTFRGERDADIGKLLSAIHISRGGAFGDERSQLRATLNECVDSNTLREFLESTEERKKFYSTKGPGQSLHKIPLANPAADLRNDVADRVYEIRCRIVHTKGESGDDAPILLLPYSPEARQLAIDIELVQYLAQSVLIAGSTQFRAQS